MSLNIGFLGPAGTFAQEAAIKYFSEKNNFLPFNRITDVFNEVNNNLIEFGVVPAENSIGGSVGDTFDFFVKSNFKVYDQITLKISQNLLSKVNKSNIKKIYSHFQSFLQCSNYISKNFPLAECIETQSNSKAAMHASEEKDTASIGPALCAKEYNLKILDSNINDLKNNETKFYIISKEINNEYKRKSLIMFSVKNKPGSLFSVLKLFKKNNVNMTRIESRPSKVRNWEYVFIVEYENPKKFSKNDKFLKKIKSECEYLDYIGRY